MLSSKRLFRTWTIAFLLAGGIVLAGCSKDSDSSTGASGVITVTGKVIAFSALPVSNTAVVVTGRPSTTTDGNGMFTVTDVTTPYDVTVIYSPSKTAMVYKGLTRSDPTIYFTGSVVAPANSATVSGTISGGAGYPLPASHNSRAIFIATDVASYASPNPATGAYSIGVSWNGAATITGTLHALQFQFDASGMPVTFKGYGTKANVTLTGGGTFASQNVALSAITGSTVAGSIVVPVGMTLGTKTLSIALNDAGDVSIGSETTSSTSFTYAVPEIPGATVVLAVSASSGSLGTTALAKRTTVGTSGLTLTLLAPPQPSLPVASATGITTTTPFTWTPVSGGTYILYINGGGGDPSYYIVTTSPTATIPDLTAQGLGLPTNKAYSWIVYSFGPFADMNAVTGPKGLFPQSYDGWRANSTSRGFTTAP